MISGIYKIENLINHKVYIGQSKDVFRRFKEHFNLSRKNSSYHLHCSMKLYGVENFNFEILLKTYDLDYWEKFFIYWYRSYDVDYGYNLTTGGQKGTKRKDDFVYTDEMRQKMSIAKKKNWQDENFRKNILQAQKDGKSTQRARKNRSEATKNMWLNGKFSEQPAKISKWAKGRKYTEESKLKMKELSVLREEKHHLDYEVYLSNGGELNYNEFCKHYKKGINDLLGNL